MLYCKLGGLCLRPRRAPQTEMPHWTLYYHVLNLDGEIVAGGWGTVLLSR